MDAHARAFEWNGRSVPIMEMIGRTSFRASAAFYSQYTRTYDWTRPDYAYWDRLYRGQLPTVRLAGLFAKPIAEHLTAWTAGDGFTAKAGHTRTDEALADFVRDNLSAILNAIKTMFRLGDAYLIVNADGTLSEASPEQVEPITDPLDYRNVTGYKIVTVLDDATIIDEYRADGRTVTIKRGGQETSTGFENLTGRVPVIHFAHDRSTNEIYGHSIYEALLKAFFEYDDVLTRSLTGVKVMGTPVQVLEHVQNVEAEKAEQTQRTEVYRAADGSEYSADAMNSEPPDQLGSWITSGEFNFKSPGSFTGDSTAMLQILFYLLQDHTHIAEWMWGGAIKGSRASVEAQMPAISKIIGGLRKMIGAPVQSLCETWLAFVSLYTPRVRELPVQITFPEIELENEALQKEKVDFALREGLITKVTALRLLDLGIEDPEAEVAAAQEEVDAQRTEDQQFDAAMMRAVLPGNEAGAPPGIATPSGNGNGARAAA